MDPAMLGGQLSPGKNWLVSASKCQFGDGHPMAGSPLGFPCLLASHRRFGLCVPSSHSCAALAQGQTLVPRPLGGYVSVAKICTQELGLMAQPAASGQGDLSDDRSFKELLGK